MINVKEYRKQLNELKVKRSVLLQQKQSKESEIERKTDRRNKLLAAKTVLSEVALLTQQKFETYVNTMVTYCIRSVYTNRDYKFIAKFEENKGRSECSLLVQDGNNDPIHPKDEDGGGLCDLISFALRVILWSLQRPHSRNTILQDEPFKFLGTGALLERAVDVVKHVLKELELQLIVNTHLPKLADMADKAWLVQHNGTYATVNLVTTSTDLSKVLAPTKVVKSEDKIVLRRRRNV